MDFKVDGSAGRGRTRKSWLECVNDYMTKVGLRKERWHTIGPCGSRLFMGASKLCKHGKFDIKRIDRMDRSHTLRSTSQYRTLDTPHITDP